MTKQINPKTSGQKKKKKNSRKIIYLIYKSVQIELKGKKWSFHTMVALTQSAICVCVCVWKCE